MARSVLDIVIKLSKQGGADRETVKGLVQVKSSLATLGMQAAVVTGMLYTAKKAMDFAKEGAQIQFVEQRFNRLADSIGANSGLMNDLRSVTRGLYSDTALMASASDLMGLGLAKSSDELMRLSKVSAGLNMNMNQLVLTLTNKTTMRFDALSVSTDGFKEKVQELQAAGMSADDAFKEAFLQQAEKQLEKVGEAADSSLGSFMQLEASTQNLLDGLKVLAAIKLGPMVSDLATNTAALAAASDDLHEMDWSQFSLAPAEGGFFEVPIVLTEIGHQFEVTAAKSDWYANRTKFLDNSLSDVTSTTFDFTGAMGELDTLMSGSLGDAWDDHNDKIHEYQSALAEAKDEEERGDILSKINAETEAYREKAAAIGFSIAQQQIEAAVTLDPTMAAEGAQILNELAFSYGMIDEKQKALVENTTSLIDKWVEQGFSAETVAGQLEAMQGHYTDIDLNAQGAKAGMAGASEASEKMTAQGPLAGAAMGVLSAELAETARQAFAAKDQVGNAISQLQKLDGMNVLATITIQVNGSIPNLGALRQSGGGGPSGAGGEGRPHIRYARGGQMDLSGWSIVGDTPTGGWTNTTELVGPGGWVFPNPIARFMRDAGLIGASTPSYGFAEGTTGGIGGTSGSTGGGWKPDRRTRVPVTQGGTDNGSDMTSTPQFVETVTPLVQTTEQAVSSVEAAQIQQMVEGRQTRAAMERQNNAITDLLKEQNNLIRRQEASMKNTITAAIQQVAP